MDCVLMAGNRTIPWQEAGITHSEPGLPGAA